MQNWHELRNFRKQKNADGSFIYTITVSGNAVKVSKEIYDAYSKFGYKMENTEIGLKCDRVYKDKKGNALRDKNGNTILLPEREISLNKLIDEEWEFPSSALSPEDSVLRDIEFETLFNSLDSLDSDEQALINALFFDELSERKYAQTLGISKTALHARKIKILNKLKILIEQ